MYERLDGIITAIQDGQDATTRDLRKLYERLDTIQTLIDYTIETYNQSKGKQFDRRLYEKLIAERDEIKKAITNNGKQLEQDAIAWLTNEIESRKKAEGLFCVIESLGQVETAKKYLLESRGVVLADYLTAYFKSYRKVKSFYSAELNQLKESQKLAEQLAKKRIKKGQKAVAKYLATCWGLYAITKRINKL